MEIVATSKIMEKKGSDHFRIFWTLMGKNLIMEKSDAGAACLSWTFFFHNSVGDHIRICYVKSVKHMEWRGQFAPASAAIILIRFNKYTQFLLALYLSGATFVQSNMLLSTIQPQSMPFDVLQCFDKVFVQIAVRSRLERMTRPRHCDACRIASKI